MKHLNTRRNKKLSKKRRKEIAVKAAKTRWSKVSFTPGAAIPEKEIRI